jgi:hypothetical protein
MERQNEWLTAEKSQIEHPHQELPRSVRPILIPIPVSRRIGRNRSEHYGRHQPEKGQKAQMKGPRYNSTIHNADTI